MNKKLLQWHPAFYAAIQIELQDEPDLKFLTEHELSKKPMRIDTLIIRKSGTTPVRKNIGQIFRKYNLIEYKSPDDHLCINDFYKVYGYACFLQADTKKVHEIPFPEITLTFICNHFPREMIRYLKDERHVTVRNVSPGIYYLENDFIPIQILISHELPPKENQWLNSLRDDLKPDEQTKQLLETYQDNKNSPLYQAAMDLIVRANQKAVEEARKMCEALRELFADEINEKVETKVKEQLDIKLKEQVDIKVKEQVDIKVKEQVQEIEDRMNALYQHLLSDNRTDDLLEATKDEMFRNRLYFEYRL